MCNLRYVNPEKQKSTPSEPSNTLCERQNIQAISSASSDILYEISKATKHPFGIIEHRVPMTRDNCIPVLIQQPLHRTSVFPYTNPSQLTSTTITGLLKVLGKTFVMVKSLYRQGQKIQHYSRENQKPSIATTAVQYTQRHTTPV